jgi:hypothetical protein
VSRRLTLATFVLVSAAIDNGLNLTSGVRFHFYAAEDQGIRKAAVTIAGAGTPPHRDSISAWQCSSVRSDRPIERPRRGYGSLTPPIG